MIDIDLYFNEITDEGNGTIGYHLISGMDYSLVKEICKQNKKLVELQKENKELKQKIK